MSIVAQSLILIVMAVAILLPWLEILKVVTIYLLWIIGQTIIIIQLALNDTKWILSFFCALNGKIQRVDNEYL